MKNRMVSFDNISDKKDYHLGIDNAEKKDKTYVIVYVPVTSDKLEVKGNTEKNNSNDNVE